MLDPDHVYLCLINKGQWGIILREGNEFTLDVLYDTRPSESQVKAALYMCYPNAVISTDRDAFMMMKTVCGLSRAGDPLCFDLRTNIDKVLLAAGEIFQPRKSHRFGGTIS